jgi:hypothetical protein
MSGHEKDSTIDWEAISESMGIGEASSSFAAKAAIVQIIGEQRLSAAVDYYVQQRAGSELARGVLWQIRPWSAMKRCYEIFRSDASVEDRCTAVELLRVVADRRVLPWVHEFLEDPHEGIQTWGAGVVDQLLWSHEIDAEDCEDLLREMHSHRNPQVTERAEFIDKFLKERNKVDGG